MWFRKGLTQEIRWRARRYFELLNGTARAGAAAYVAVSLIRTETARVTHAERYKIIMPLNLVTRRSGLFAPDTHVRGDLHDLLFR